MQAELMNISRGQVSRGEHAFGSRGETVSFIVRSVFRFCPYLRLAPPAAILGRVCLYYREFNSCHMHFVELTTL